jgi:RNA polymerase sigma-70 factor (ECF subfamily)
MVSGDPDEKALVEAAQRDPRRFAALYERHFERVYAFVARRVPARTDAQDLTAEVFQQALAGLARFEWRGVPFAAWLYRIAANAVADHHNRAARERDATAEAAGPDAAEPRGSGIEDAERRASVYRAVRELPADQRRVVEMRFGEDRAIAEVARILGRSEGAVKQLQLRALQTLKARLDQPHA